jgi:hypothetical protein
MKGTTEQEGRSLEVVAAMKAKFSRPADLIFSLNVITVEHRHTLDSSRASRLGAFIRHSSIILALASLSCSFFRLPPLGPPFVFHFTQFAVADMSQDAVATTSFLDELKGIASACCCCFKHCSQPTGPSQQQGWNTPPTTGDDGHGQHDEFEMQHEGFEGNAPSITGDDGSGQHEEHEMHDGAETHEEVEMYEEDEMHEEFEIHEVFDMTSLSPIPEESD